MFSPNTAFTLHSFLSFYSIIIHWTALCPPPGEEAPDAVVGSKLFFYGKSRVIFWDGMQDCLARGLRVSSFQNREEFDAIQGEEGERETSD